MANQNEILKRVKLLMEYDTSMTLNENLVLIENPPLYPTTFTHPSDKTQTNLPGYRDINSGKYVSTRQSNPVKPSDFGLREWPTIPTPSNTVLEIVGKDIIATLKCTKAFYVDLSKGEVRLAIRDARDFFMETFTGALIDIFVSIAGIEVGGPILMEILEVLFTVNDYGYYLESKNKPEHQTPAEIKGGWEKFKWQFLNNEDFSRLMVDLMVVATRGVVRYKNNFLNWIKGGGAKLIKNISSLLIKVTANLGKAGKLGKFLESRLSSFTIWLDDFSTKLTKLAEESKIKNPNTPNPIKGAKMAFEELNQIIKNKNVTQLYIKKLQNVPSKIPEAVKAAKIAYFVQLGLVYTIQMWIASLNTKNIDEIDRKFNEDLMSKDSINATIQEQQMKQNTELFKNNPTWKVKFKGKETPVVEPPIYSINGKDYTYIYVASDEDLMDTTFVNTKLYKLKEIKK